MAKTPGKKQAKVSPPKVRAKTVKSRAVEAGVVKDDVAGHMLDALALREAQLGGRLLRGRRVKTFSVKSNRQE